MSRMWMFWAVLAVSGCQHLTAAQDNLMKLVMPGARPMTDDSYMCTSFDVKELSGGQETVYVTGFNPNADAAKAHHMLLYACDVPLKQPGEIYDCLHHSLCSGGSSIMFAWAKNAPPTVLPKGVGFKMDYNKRKYLVLQVHYAKPLPEPDRTGLNLVIQSQPTQYSAGMLLLLQGGITIPAHTAVTHADVNCELPAQVPIHMFAFRTHAHSLGMVITGYAYNEQKNEYREIARGSPQWPQAFYPMKTLQTVKPGEVVTARCTYNSSTTDHATHIGPSSGDEMCNLYIMFFTEPGKTEDFLTCVNEQAGSQITRNLPADSDVPPASNPLLEEKAKNSSVDTGINEINYQKLFTEEMDTNESKKKGGLEDGVLMVSDYNFTMPGAVTDTPEDYMCTGLDIGDLSPDEPLWIIKFSAIAAGNRAHHIILAKCKAPPGREGDIWDCRHHQICRDESKVLFAWAKHAPPTELPQNVGFALEDDDHLVLQVHYATANSEPDHSGLQIRFTTTKPKYTAGIMLLGRTHLDIPAYTPLTHGDANCQVEAENPLHVFAYRVHAHNYATVISGYRYNKKNKDWQLLAKGNPNWPQAFYPMEHEEWVHPGEYVHARCSFNTTTSNKSIAIGPENGDEMCNLYLMYYTLSERDDFKLCFDEADQKLASLLPAGNDVPLPRNAMLEHKATGCGEQPQSFNNGAHHLDAGAAAKKADQSVQKRPGVEDNSGREPKGLPGSDFSAVPNWPDKATVTRLGQLSGVAIDIYGNAVIFHRGDRIWNGNTFNNDNTYGGDRERPISQDTVLTVNSTGHVINSWGKDIFFLPHMITVDSQNNVWMTDVALHQVFKFSPYGGDQKPLIVLGERFVPGSDDRHYCKPTAVAVSKDTNTFFVSDGYCNSRIIKYTVTVSGDGKHEVSKATEWGKGAGPFSITKGPYSFNVPHGLALAEDRKEICLADRENGRVQCFSTESGELTKSIQPPEFGSRIFSVAYSAANGGKLHAVSGPEFTVLGKKPLGYIVDMASGNLEGTWQVPGGLQNPHDIAVSADGGTVYVVELQPYVVWKLTNGQPSSVLPSAAPGSLPTPASPGLPDLMNGAKKLVPEMSGSVMIAAAISVPLTLLLACCLACRKCRKRGKGKMYTEPSKKKNWNVGDILGRSKEGFQPVNTDEREGMLGDDSESEVEEFSVPAMHA